MEILIVCLLIAVILPYLVKVVVGYAMQKAKGGYNNNYPRLQQASLEGFGARAVATQLNCFESLIVFSIAILTALATHHISFTIQVLAISYIVSRFIYVFLYLINRATLRSIVWFVGFVCCISIICLSMS
jgi:uncharacterized MAPEG superfamily protein